MVEPPPLLSFCPPKSSLLETTFVPVLVLGHARRLVGPGSSSSNPRITLIANNLQNFKRTKGGDAPSVFFKATSSSLRVVAPVVAV